MADFFIVDPSSSTLSSLLVPAASVPFLYLEGDSNFGVSTLELHSGADLGGFFGSKHPENIRPMVQEFLDRNNFTVQWKAIGVWHKRRMRYREFAIFVDSIVGILSVISVDSEGAGFLNLRANPCKAPHLTKEYYKKNKWSRSQQSKWKQMAAKPVIVCTNDFSILPVLQPVSGFQESIVIVNAEPIILDASASVVL